MELKDDTYQEYSVILPEYGTDNNFQDFSNEIDSYGIDMFLMAENRRHVLLLMTHPFNHDTFMISELLPGRIYN